MLFIVEVILFVRFFSECKGPRRFTWVVVFLLANALVALMAVCADSWKLLIKQKAMPAEGHSWPLPTMKICDVIAATIEQCFLLSRYYGFSKAIFPTGLVALLIVARVVFGLKSAIELIVFPQFGHPGTLMSTTVSFAISASVDILIPILLIWELRKIKTSHYKTQSLIHRLSLNAASTGCCVALTEILLLSLFRTEPEIMPFAAPALGPLYGITVLINMFVGQRTLSPEPSRTKTGNVSSLDSFQLRRSIIPTSSDDPHSFNPQLRDSESCSKVLTASNPS